MTGNPAGARGHRRSDVDYLAGKVWFALLARSAGELSYRAIARRVHGDGANPLTWKRYRDGKRVPVAHGGRDPVADAEAVWPGTGRVFRSSMWSALNGQWISTKHADRSLKQLGEPWSTIVLGKGYTSPGVTRTLSHVFYELEQHPDFETLETIVLLLAKADHLGNVPLRNKLCAFYRRMIPQFLERGQIPLHAEVFACVDRFAKEWDFSVMNHRQEISSDWSAAIPAAKALHRNREKVATVGPADRNNPSSSQSVGLENCLPSYPSSSASSNERTRALIRFISTRIG